MKSILCLITYNRFLETRLTIESLLNTKSISDVLLFIVDNGSTEPEMIDYLKTVPCFKLILNNRNEGCPQALNSVLEFREKGQHFIKIDNDIKVLTSNWLDEWLNIIEYDQSIGAIGGYYGKAFKYNRFVKWHFSENQKYAEVSPIMGHFMFHRGDIMDEIGFFDVLHPTHVYGFEDILFCQKIKTIGYKCAILPNVEIENLQKVDSYADFANDTKENHTDKMFPYFQERMNLIKMGIIKNSNLGYPIIQE